VLLPQCLSDQIALWSAVVAVACAAISVVIAIMNTVAAIRSRRSFAKSGIMTGPQINAAFLRVALRHAAERTRKSPPQTPRSDMAAFWATSGMPLVSAQEVQPIAPVQQSLSDASRAALSSQPDEGAL
jgi:hypothetical protein